MPNSTLTAVASLSLSALDPTVGPSMALGRCAAFAAMVKLPFSATAIKTFNLKSSNIVILLFTLQI